MRLPLLMRRGLLFGVVLLCATQATFFAFFLRTRVQSIENKGRASRDWSFNRSHVPNDQNYSSNACDWNVDQTFCRLNGVTYECVLVDGALQHALHDAAPAFDCLDGNYSWGKCTDGKFLCRDKRQSPVFWKLTDHNESHEDLAIVILSCSRQIALDAALTTLVAVEGIVKTPIYVSLDCVPGVSVDGSSWRTRGLTLHVLNSPRRYISETGEARYVAETDEGKRRTDERVTRAWIHAVSFALSKHRHVLYMEEDHIVQPSIVHDAGILLRERDKVCPTCFAVQLGCHGDCWGFNTIHASAGDVARMEPGNMGVVYSRDQWTWFQQTLHEYCSLYGHWDINLHHHLWSKGTFTHALTLAKSRVMHISACTSDRRSVGKGFCNKTNVHRIMDDFVKHPNRIDGILVDRGAAKLPDLRIPDVHSIKADAETRSRCVEAGKINRTIMNEAGVHGFVDTEVVDTVPAYRQVAA